jgi:Protein of unknown function (DUF2793)
MTNTSRLKLPFISPGQAQKEWVHNEALQILDSVACAIVEEPHRNDPPATPAEGSSYIIGSAPTGAWAGKAGQVATMSQGGWRFLMPVDGLSVLIRSNRLRANFFGGGWEIGIARAAAVEIGGDQMLSTQAAAIAEPAGGTTADAEARAAIGQILAALRHHGLIAT